MRFLAICVVFLLLIDCTSNTIFKKPNDLIPKDTMALVIEDLFIASSSKNLKNKFMQRRINYHPLVVLKYNIDSARFSRSSIYYMSTVDDYQKILEQVVHSLKEKKEAVKNQIKVLDSVKLTRELDREETKDSLRLKSSENSKRLSE